MRSLITVLLFIVNSLSSGFNLVGNTYVANFRVPIVSKSQNIKIHFIDKTNANLKLDGFINNEGNVYYIYDHKRSTFTYKADETIEKIMRKYLVYLYDVFYSESNDTPIITIQSKLFRFKQKITLRREKAYKSI